MQIADVLRRHGLDRPDGRILHRYEVTDKEYEDLRKRLYGWRYGFHGARAGELVLLLAEWSYRNAHRLMGFWDDVEAGLGLRIDDHFSRWDLGEGLEYWHRSAMRDNGARWVIMMIREGGFPINFETKGFDQVTRSVVARYGWARLSAVDATAVAEVSEYLAAEGAALVAVLRSREAAAALAELLGDLARYRALLALRGLLPAAGQSLEDWEQKIGPEHAPELHLPLRGKRHSTLLDLFFAALRIEDPPAPPKLEAEWPAEEGAPVLRLIVPPGGIPLSWARETLGEDADVQRLAIGPACMPSRWVELRRTDAGGSFALADGARSCTWPLADVAGDGIDLIRRRLSGNSRKRTELPVPRRARAFVFDAEGKLLTGNVLRAGEPHRIFLPEAPRVEFVGRHVEYEAGSRTATIQGEDGEELECCFADGSLSLTFASAPMDPQLDGMRWPSSFGQAPYLGWPHVWHPELGEVECRPGPRWLRLEACGVGWYQFPDGIPSVFPDGILELRACGRTGRVRIAVLPRATRIQLARPERNGVRRLSIVSPGLARVALFDGERQIASVTPGANGEAELVLPRPPDVRATYVLELSYTGAGTVRAGMVDQRPSFAVRLAGGEVRLGRAPARDKVVLEHEVAGGCILVGAGHKPGETFVCCARSINHAANVLDEISLGRHEADADGNFALKLESILADLDPEDMQEITIVSESGERWRLVVSDSSFEEEPNPGEPYGKLCRDSRIYHGLTFHWIDVSAPWQRVMVAPMTKGEDGRYKIPDNLPPAPGGRLAAPFDGERRVGFVRLFGGDVPAIEPDDDAFAAAMLRPHRLTAAIVRQELTRGPVARDRLLAAVGSARCLDGGHSLDLLRWASLDGSVPVYAALLGLDVLIDGPDELRGVPLGAWIVGALAAKEVPATSWVRQLFDLRDKGIGWWLLIADLARHAPGLELSVPEADQVRMLLEGEGTCRGFTPPPIVKEALEGPLPSITFGELRKPGLWARLVNDWRKQSDRVPAYDEQVFEAGEIGELTRWITAAYADAGSRLAPAVRLAATAARVALDPSLECPERLRLRRLLLRRRQQRRWNLMRPLVDALHLYALWALHARLIKRWQGDPHAATRDLSCLQVDTPLEAPRRPRVADRAGAED